LCLNYFNFDFGFALLILNGFITFIGLLAFKLDK
jgi:SSS family solute:Na+ symporter